MRNVTNTVRSVLAVAALGLAVSACDETQNTAEEPLVEDAMAGEDSPLTGDDIEEAVPGIEQAAPEGDTPNAADLGDEENAEFSDVEDPADVEAAEEPGT